MLVENCFKISIGSFPKGLVRKCEDGDFPAGQLKISNGEKTLNLSYSFQIEADNGVATFSFISPYFPHETRKIQTIPMEIVPSAWGKKCYFQCTCGRRCFTIYLRPDGKRFGCRKCLDLTYEIETVNRQLMNGDILRINRLNVLLEKRDKIKRIFYDGKTTRRAQSFIHLREKWGL